MNEALTQNQEAEWVPAIPEPSYGIKKKCKCGEKFWTEEGYRAHYAYAHILKVQRRKRSVQ
jgi:hypothetical protein